jgi:hypothetical protein
MSQHNRIQSVTRRSVSFSVYAYALIASFAFINARAELFPSARRFDWKPGVTVGVPGGVDQYLSGGANDRKKIIDVTKPPYNADNTGATNCLSAINTAIADAIGPCVVYLPAGTYRVDGQLYFDENRDDVTLRGAGMNATIIKRYGGGGSMIYLGTSADAVGMTTVTGERGKGATTLTVADASGLRAGQCIYIRPDDVRDDAKIVAGAYPIVHVSSYRGTRQQISRITNISSNTITIFPPLTFDCSGLTTTVSGFGRQLERVGIEDLTLDASTQSGDPVQVGIYYDHVYACWTRNVKVYKIYNRAIVWASVLQCEARRCELRERMNADGPNSAGILTGNANFCLFEDNIVYRFFPAIEVAGATNGNVFAYNCLEDSRSGDVIGGCLNSNHGPHNSFNLYEGNVAPSFQADGYYGSTSEDTVYRNWFHCTVLGHPEARGYAFRLNRFTRGYNVIGNIIGQGTQWGLPNIGNANFDGVAQPTAGDFWTDWTAFKTAEPGRGPGPGGYQELDLDVEASSTFKGNFYALAADAPASEATIGTDSLLPSQFRTAKPAWFGDLAWPPFDSNKADAASYDDIPAGYRFTHDGQNPPGVSSPTPPRAPSNLRVEPGI